MAPAGPGGRPRNAWSSSRRRKLVRLYTLTNLNKDEIQRVLQEHDFNPSSSDVQKKLRSLLPSDYAKEHRKFRPSNESIMKQRLLQIRRCRSGRISKIRASIGNNRALSKPEARSFNGTPKQSLESFEGPESAFRNYNSSNESGTFIVCSNLANAQSVVPSLLLLDGSSMEQGSTLNKSSNTQSLPKAPHHLSVTPRITLDSDRRAPNPQLKALSDSRDMANKKTNSIGSLGRRLANKYSDNYLKHIISVLRYSSSNSFRSSLASLSSLGSSRKTGIFARQSSSVISGMRSSNLATTGNVYGDYPTIDEDREATAASSRPSDGIFNNDMSWAELTKEEEDIWNELVNEVNLSPLPRPRTYGFASPLNRSCCSTAQLLPLHARCGKCGFTSSHMQAITFKTITTDSSVLSNILDLFGNSPLHCAAAGIGTGDVSKVRTIVDSGVDVFVQNTSGENFMHLLCGRDPGNPDDVQDFVALLYKLSDLNFPFSERDYHGRTILHTLFQSPQRGRYYSINTLSNIFAVIVPDLNSRDNAGCSILSSLQDIVRDVRDNQYHHDFRQLVARFSGHQGGSSSYKRDLSRLHTAEQLSSWLLVERNAGRMTWIDADGDTPLAAILKYSASISGISLKNIMEETAFGVKLHMQDRFGDTPLVIAARRGLRPVVTLLLERGSNVHTRNYRGVGILSQLESCLAQAKLAGDDKLHAMIWTCNIALIDAGAKSNPTLEDEIMFPALRRPPAAASLLSQATP